MTKFIGRLLDVGLGKETTRGSAVAPSHWLAKTASDYDDKAEFARVTGSHGSIYQVADDKRVLKRAEGSFETELDADAHGLVLLSAFGATTPTVHAGETVVYDHTYTLDNTNLHDTLTILYKDPNLEREFANSIVDSLEYSLEVGGLATCTVGFKGRASETDTGNTPAYGLKYYFPHQAFTLKLAATAAALGAASAIPVRSVTLTIEQNADYVHRLGSVDPTDVVNKAYYVHGTFVLDHEATTYKDLFMDGTSRALLFQLKDTDTTIGVAANPELKFELNRVYFEGWEKDNTLDEITNETITFIASLDTSQELFNSVVLTNLTASY